jgi:signal transduction histidine kinase
VIAYLVLALGVFLTAPLLAYRWSEQPFLGSFLTKNLFVNAVAPISGQPWPMYDRELRAGARLLSINQAPVRTAQDVETLLAGLRPGDRVQITAAAPQGAAESAALPLAAFPSADFFGFFTIPYLVGLVYLGAATWIFVIRRQHANGRVFSLFATSLGLALVTTFDSWTTHRLLYAWTAGLALAAGSGLHLAFLLPRPSKGLGRRPWLAGLFYLAAAALGLAAVYALDFSPRPEQAGLGWQVEVLGLAAALLVFLGRMGYRQLAAASPIERERARTLFLSGLIAFLPLAAWAVLTLLVPTATFSPYLLIPLAVMPVAAAYTIQRSQLLQTELILSRIVLYGLMTVLAASGYALLVTGLSLLLVSIVSPNHPLVVGAMVFILALLFAPVRSRLQALVDAAFFRGEKIYQARLEEFTQALTTSVELPDILRLLRATIDQAIAPARLHIFIFDTLTNHYSAWKDDSGKPTSEVSFLDSSPTALYLNRSPAPLYLTDPDSLPPEILKDHNRVTLLGAQLYFPLPGQKRLSGWLALAARKSGEAYSMRELRFLESLSTQAALAIERAQVIVLMENRVREMDILARVAQGVNVTVSIDDLLELVYAQTSLAIPCRDFQVTLYNPKTRAYQHAFYVEADERLSERENRPMETILGLEPEVIRSGRALITSEYQRECQQRGINPTQKGVHAWMCTPLNAGAETIGAASLGSRDPSITYTQEQLNLFRAIADQTAGAITKARLLEESQRRARQLASLNEVTRQLATNLESEPLLKFIIENAVQILNCEAGSLLLVDRQTDELVFRVTTGPVAENLIGKRLAPGAGIVGKAVKTRQPIIVNQAQKSSEWFAQTDRQTGFSTQSLLVIPLMSKDQVTGVVEVINRRDGQPFTDDDEALLSAYSGQAAVAIENARLYTLTDQALTERVEELSVMQRIDRELNTSLDIAQAMRITLEWAMRQSTSEAGLIGVIAEDGLQVMASQGYTAELAAYQDKPLQLDAFGLTSILRGGQPARLSVSAGPEPRAALLQGALSQVVLPIRRETDAIGLILLESQRLNACSDEALEFLSRLCDHASIAISNAQLYAAVQAANTAKSEFVSFVAHELKNPMTSIKGYTELLAQGAVGAVSAPQANFLATIRTNIDRMNTLVSDLNDMSKIEAGRLRLDFKSFQVNDLIDESVRSLRRQIDEKGQQLAIQSTAELPAVWADRTRVSQVLVNLISNAFKYTPQGGMITVIAEQSANYWDPKGAPRVVHLAVQDTGIGINPEDQKKIFQKFFRSEDPKTREVPGTGLGLNITRSLVEMQGGQIWFESEFRKGTTFHFTVPVAEG